MIGNKKRAPELPGSVKLPFILRTYNRLAKPFLTNVITVDSILAQANITFDDLQQKLSPNALSRLQVICDDLCCAADLSAFGRWTTKKVLVDCLLTRFQIENSLQHNRQALETPIKQPIFILGLPRTGTTILFNLLSQDPAHRSPRTWEVDHPVPAPTPDDYHGCSRIKKSQFSVDNFHKLAPAFNAIHPQGARLAEENQRIMAMNMGGCGFQHFFRAPQFQAMQLQEQALDSFAWHKRYLAHLQTYFYKPRWLLKSPDDTLNLKAIFATYPDALIIHTHRNPKAAIASVASLTYTVRKVFSDSTETREVGADQLDFWSKAVNRCVKDRISINKENRFFDVHFDALVADPMSVVKQIYEKFNLPLSEQTKHTMASFMKNNQRERYGKHLYTPGQFGLCEEGINSAFEEYLDSYSS